MSPKSFAALCAVTAVAVVFAVVAVVSQPKIESTDLQAVPVLPTLARDSERLKSVVIRQAGNTLSLDWDGKEWRARERNNYPADGEKVGNLLLTLARMNKIEGKTKDPARYARLEVEDPTGKESKSRQISLIDGSGKEIGNVILGKRQYSLGAQGNNTYVRLSGDPQVWLASGEVADSEVSDWLQKNLANIDADQVARVTVTHPNGEKVVVGRTGPDQSMSIERLPKTAAAASDATADKFAEILTDMTFEDVAPAAEKPFRKEATTTAVIDGKNGFQVVIEMAEIDGGAWIKLKGTPSAVAREAKSADPKAADTATDWAKVIGDLNARAEGLVFKVTNSKAAPFKATLADLSKKAAD